MSLCNKNRNLKPSAGAARILEEQNQARRDLGLPELSYKNRKCLQCRKEFLSIEARTCDPCRKAKEEFEEDFT